MKTYLAYMMAVLSAVLLIFCGASAVVLLFLHIWLGALMYAAAAYFFLESFRYAVRYLSI